MFEFNREFFTTFGFTILNILILFFILKKILFKPVTAHMENRNKKIQEAIDTANENKIAIETMRAEYDQKLKDASEEGKKIVNEYIARANKEYEEAMLRAKEDAKKIISEARAEIELEKKQALTELKSEVSGLVLLAGEKIIKKNLDNETNRKVIDDFIKDEVVA